MKTSKRLREAEIALGARSRHKAEIERKNVGAERLAAAITDFIEWRTFAYWIRLIVEKEGLVNSRIEATLRDRCPGFLESVIEYRRSHPNEREFLWLRLIDWIDCHIFDYARSEGWQHALGYYAAHDERLDQIRAYWLRCDDQWKIIPRTRLS